MTAEALVDGVWGEEWSPGREKNLHALVYQLRRRLAGLEPGGGARLARDGTGYRLVLGLGELDVAVFRELARRDPDAARAGAAEQAGSCSGRLWGVAGRRWPTRRRCACGWPGEAARLEDARLAVTEERIGAHLALGRYAR